jgi:hypothetical protein
VQPPILRRCPRSRRRIAKPVDAAIDVGLRQKAHAPPAPEIEG